MFVFSCFLCIDNNMVDVTLIKLMYKTESCVDYDESQSPTQQLTAH